MFERFTREARDVVVGAQEEARRLRHGRIGTEHLLLGLLVAPATTSARTLTRYGITSAVVVDSLRTSVADDLNAAALNTLGIDLDAVRERVEEAFGPGALDRRAGARSPGHLPFTPQAKRVLELALREALAMRSRSITDVHILLGLLHEGSGVAMHVLADRGVDAAALRRELVVVTPS